MEQLGKRIDDHTRHVRFEFHDLQLLRALLNRLFFLGNAVQIILIQILVLATAATIPEAEKDEIEYEETVGIIARRIEEQFHHRNPYPEQQEGIGQHEQTDENTELDALLNGLFAMCLEHERTLLLQLLFLLRMLLVFPMQSLDRSIAEGGAVAVVAQRLEDLVIDDLLFVQHGLQTR